ncbi:MAG: DUF1828 domain-containing protein [Bradymonadaceae bacterium]
MRRVCDRLGEQLGALYECAEMENGERTRVRTPFLYPDGTYIDLYVSDGEPITVSDLGETLRWLDLQTHSSLMTPKRRGLVEDVCTTHGVDFFKGMLVVRTEDEELADAVVRLGEAAVRVADLWFTFRRRSVQSTSDEVDAYLEEIGVPHERNKKIPGRSEKSWKVDFHTRTRARTAYVDVLTTGSRSNASRLVDHAVAMWHDLSHLEATSDTPISFVSLFDDTIDVWREEDFAQVEELSEVAFWSDPEGFGDLLTAS